MKHLYIIFISFFTLTSFVTEQPVTSSHGEEMSKSCESVNTTFNSNEELRFKIYYNWNFAWIPAGYVDFSAVESTYAGKPSYLFKATGKTLKTYDPIFKVRDYFQSYVDKETMQPLKYVRNTDEGGYTHYEELRFDYANKKVTSKSGKTKEKAESKTFTFDGCTYDIVSILYQLRTLDLDDLKEGEKVPINIFFDEEQYDLYVKYLGKEEINVKGQGKYYTHKVSPLLIKGGTFEDVDKMTIYVTADDNKLPVLIESPIRVGSIKAVIHSANNLKYPVKAKR